MRFSDYNYAINSGFTSAIRNHANTYSTTGSQLAFLTSGSSGAAAPVEHMRIDNQGYVGIGTPTPGYKLDVVASSNSDGFRVRQGTTSKFILNGDGVLTWGSAADYGTLTWDTGVAIVAGQSSNDLKLVAGTAYVYLKNSTGNVGIGTVSPGAKLEIVAGVSDVDTEQIRFGRTNNGADGLRYNSIYSLSQGGGTGRISFRIHDSVTTTSQATVMSLLGNGNVGIGTTSPNFTGIGIDHVVLSVGNSAAGMGMIELAGYRTSDADLGRVVFGNQGTRLAEIVASRIDSNTSTKLSFSTADAGTMGVRMTISKTGSVGIGTITPNYKLEVNGSFAATTKSFVIDHPTKEGKKLRYGSLEGPENAIYIRGKTTSKIIELPDYWTKLVDPDSISVQLTSIGSHQKLYVEKIEDNKVYIANENLLAKSINCFFYILAERADVEKLQVEIDG